VPRLPAALRSGKHDVRTLNVEVPRGLDELVAWVAAGRRVDYLFFWGHQPRADGTLGPGCLSQWWPTSFRVEGTTYRSAEQFMMAAKARLFGDANTERRIIATQEPAEAKALGREVRGFDENIWAEHRFGIVVAAGMAKFAENRDLRAYLGSTSGRVLVEASPRDRVWGIGLAASDEQARDPRQWRGLNLLGFALMDVRATLVAGTT
jgi:ribA/ribD-fused uncharacterized protein